MFLLWECSTPFVFMRWGLHALGRVNTKLYLYNGLTMMAVFFLCRNVMGVGKPHIMLALPAWKELHICHGAGVLHECQKHCRLAQDARQLYLLLYSLFQ